MDLPVFIHANKRPRVQTSFPIPESEAFRGRGDEDHQLSHDLEDLVAVVDGRPELLSEVDQADAELRPSGGAPAGREAVEGG